MPSFRDFIDQSTRNFWVPCGHEDCDTEDEIRIHVEKALQNVHLGTIRDAFPDIDDVVPEVRGQSPDHPAFLAAIEMAIREAIVKEHFEIGGVNSDFAP